VNLLDGGGELLGLFEEDSAFLIVDRSGFVRHAAPLAIIESLPQVLRQTSNLTPVLEPGKPAPDFIVQDMNGRSWHLAQLRGKKNLLLTFFPKWRCCIKVLRIRLHDSLGV
jgi:hypothetical protein